MERYNAYFEQLVTEAFIDQMMDWAEEADRAISEDSGLTGVHLGGVVTQNGPPDMNVLISAPFVGHDPDGKRIYWALQQTADCSLDYLGAPTDVVGAPNERYLGVFALYDETLAVPKTDGNGLPVYSEEYESFEIRVVQGTEAAIGVAAPPATPTGAVRLCNVHLIFGQVQVLNADITVDDAGFLRDDWARVTGAVLPDFVYGNPQTAVEALFAYCDTLAAATGIAFTATENWHDATTIAGITVGAAINEIVADLADDNGAASGEWGSDKVGSDAHVTVGGFADLTRGSVWDQLVELADYVDGHIGGGAPAHAAAAVTTAAIAGSPESHAGNNVQTALIEVFGHLNARTERSIRETVDGEWKFTAGGFNQYDDQHVRFAEADIHRTLMGGSSPPQFGDDELSGKRFDLHNWAHPWDSANQTALGATLALIDICVTFDSSNNDRRAIAVLDQTNCRVYLVDPLYNSTWYRNSGANLAAGLPAPQVAQWNPTAMCSDGVYLYIMFEGDHAVAANRQHYVQAYAVADWSVKAGWPATGTQLPGVAPLTGDHPGTPNLTDRIIVADNTNLATLNSWVPIANANSPAVSIVTLAAGAVSNDGAGDVTVVGAAVYACGGLASDGTNIFFTTYDTTPVNGEIASCTIANPSVGSGIAGFPQALPANPIIGWCQELIYDGTYLYAVVYDHDGTNRLGLWWHSLNVGAGAFKYISNTAAEKYNDARFAAFDGSKLWIQTERIVGGVIYISLLGVHTDMLSFTSPDVATGLSEAGAVSYQFEDVFEGNDVSVLNTGRCAFDGDSVWMIMDRRASQNQSGHIRRLPRAGYR